MLSRYVFSVEQHNMRCALFTSSSGALTLCRCSVFMFSSEMRLQQKHTVLRKYLLYIENIGCDAMMMKKSVEKKYEVERNKVKS